MNASSRLFARALQIGLLVAGGALVVSGVVEITRLGPEDAAAIADHWLAGRRTQTVVASSTMLSVALIVLVPAVAYIALIVGFFRERRRRLAILAILQLVVLIVMATPVLASTILGLVR